MTIRSKPFSKTEWARVQDKYKAKHRVAGLAPPEDPWMQEAPIRDAIIKQIKEWDDAGLLDDELMLDE